MMMPCDRSGGIVYTIYKMLQYRVVFSYLSPSFLHDTLHFVDRLALQHIIYYRCQHCYNVEQRSSHHLRRSAWIVIPK